MKRLSVLLAILLLSATAVAEPFSEEDRKLFMEGCMTVAPDAVEDPDGFCACFLGEQEKLGSFDDIDRLTEEQAAKIGEKCLGVKPAPEPAPTPVGDCVKEAAVSAALEALDADGVRALVDLGPGPTNEDEEAEAMMMDAPDAVAVVGAFLKPGCYTALVAACKTLEPCAEYRFLKLTPKGFEATPTLTDQAGPDPVEVVDFNHDGQHEILSFITIPDTSGDGPDMNLAALYGVKGGALVELWESGDVEDASDISFEDVDKDGVDELIDGTNNKRFRFDGTRFAPMP